MNCVPKHKCKNKSILEENITKSNFNMPKRFHETSKCLTIKIVFPMSRNNFLDHNGFRSIVNAKNIN